MSYRRALLTRWSRRDRLAVVAVALAVAFLTGTTLVVLAVGSSTAGIAAEHGARGTVTEYESVSAARAHASAKAMVIPIAEGVAPVAGGPGADGTATAVGVPANASVGGVRLRGRNATLGTLDRPRTVRLRGGAAGAGGDGRVTVDLAPRDGGVFPPGWYVVSPETVETLGPTGALVVEPAAGVPAAGVPLEGALAFFLAGTRSALAALSVAAVVGATLVGVTVYSVTRMTVRDRLQELFVLRASGGTRWRVRRLFLARGLLLVGVGVALGYAIGVVLTTVVVNAAVVLDLPTTLTVRVTGRAVGYLLPVYGGVLAVGGLATLVAVQPELGRPPARIGATRRRSGGRGLGLRLVAARQAVPTAATLAAFVTFLLVVVGMAGVAGPLAAPDTATVTEPGSQHPIGSRVPAAYAEPLRERGIAASPEILLFLVRDGQPFLARGAEFAAFANVSDAHLVRGRRPTAPNEAVVGADLARSLGVAVGDGLLVGGSLRPAVARVEVVGTFEASGPDDDQLVVSLPTARRLSTVGPGQVNVVRAERLPADARPGTGSTVTAVSAPGTVAAGSRFAVAVTVRNDGLRARTVTRTVRVGDRRHRVEVTVAATDQRTVRVPVTAGAPGEYTVRAGTARTTVRVLPPDALRLVGVPARAPPGSAPRVRVVHPGGDPVANATVTAGNWSGRTDAAGRVRVPLERRGTVRVVATRGDTTGAANATDAANATAAANVTVTPRASRRLAASVDVRPPAPSLLVAPTLSVDLSNPWNASLTRTVTVDAPGGPYDRRVSVPPGARRTIEVGLPRRPPGRHEVTVGTANVTLTSHSYRVTGDDRVVSALAASGRSGSSGIGRAVAVVFGNLELALGALVLLGAAMAIGAAAATFAGAVHANRRVLGLHRTVGATRRQLVAVVLGDAVRLGAVAVVAAVAAGVLAVALLDAAGLLTVYGVAIAAAPSPALLAAVAVGGLLVVLAGAGVATAAVLARQPAALLGGGERG